MTEVSGAVGLANWAAAAQWTGSAVPEQVGFLRSAVAAYALGIGVPHTLVDDIRLAVSEALSNAVMHAYRDHGGRIEVRAGADPAAGLMWVAIRDYGVGCAPRADSPGIGKGLELMAALARTVDLDAPIEGGTDVRLTFAVGADPPDRSEMKV